MNIQNIGNSTVVSPPVVHVGNKSTVAARDETKPTPKLTVDTTKANAKSAATSEQLSNAVSNINQAMRLSNRNLQFSVDPDTKMTVVKLTDTDTGEVIRQFPSEEALAIAHSIDHFQQGLLLKQQA